MKSEQSILELVEEYKVRIKVINESIENNQEWLRTKVLTDEYEFTTARSIMETVSRLLAMRKSLVERIKLCNDILY